MRYLLLLFTTILFSQPYTKPDFIQLQAIVQPDASTKSITGSVKYQVNISTIADTIKIDAVGMQFTNLQINQKPVAYKNTGKQLHLYQGFVAGDNTITFNYQATPKQALYFVGNPKDLQIWTQGQGKYTSHWLPSFDDVNEKLIFNISVVYDSDYQVIANGLLSNCSNINTKQKQWQYSMNKPMSSYLVMFAIGKYLKKTTYSKSKIPLEFYLKPADSAKFDCTYKYSEQIFDYLEKEIQISYPWQIYKQIPIVDFLYAGMENTSATTFAQDYVVDSIAYIDKPYINVNAHELAHQWFGNLVTAKSSKDHWLQEGFATYYSLLAEKNIFGDNYFNWQLLLMANEINTATKTDTLRILDPKASSLTFYKKGAWALHYLRETIGAKAFQKAVKQYIQKAQYQNVTTQDFLDQIQKYSNLDTQKFKKEWLESTGFNYSQAKKIVQKNKYTNQYFVIQDIAKLAFDVKQKYYKKILQSNEYYLIKQAVLYQLANLPFNTKKDLLQLAIHDKNIKVRQALAESLYDFPKSFKDSYFLLLEDASYYTQEIVLQKAWQQFPESRNYLLEKTKNKIGFNNHNLAIQWLELALATPSYYPEKHIHYYNQLVTYSAPEYDSETRQRALQVLLTANNCDILIIKSLINATKHHRWQFVKFAKTALKNIIKTQECKQKIEAILPYLSVEEQKILKQF